MNGGNFHAKALAYSTIETRISHRKVGSLNTDFFLPKDNQNLSIHPSYNLQLQKLLQPRTPIEPSKAALPHPTMRQRGFVVYGHVVDVDGSGLLR